MRRLQICAIAGIVVLGISVRPMAGPQSLDARDARWEVRVIGSLDACVQERFKEVDRVFGFRRIVRPGETAHRFRPENVRELEDPRRISSGTRADWPCNPSIARSRTDSHSAAGRSLRAPFGPAVNRA